MIVIRLKRVGRKKSPFFHIIATEKKYPLKGKFIEKLGYFNPINLKNTKIDINKILKWKNNGAEISPRVKHIMQKIKENA